MKSSFISLIFLFVSVVHSQGPESDACLKQVLPQVAGCDAEIVQIDKDCAAAFKLVDAECKGKDSMECLMKYFQLTKECKDKRAAYKTKCKPIYAAVKTVCSGAPAPPATGPESERCLKILVAQLAVCDAEIAKIDKFCNHATRAINSDCLGKDTEECGNRYLKLNALCDSKRKPHAARCGPIYAAHKKECLGILSAPATGPESDRCLKQLFPAIGVCDAEIAGIEKKCIQGFKDIDKECKGKDSLECGIKYLQYDAACKSKRKAYSTRCVPIYATHKKECTGLPSAPTTGPESDRCLKQLVPALAVCDAEVAQIDKHCNAGFKTIDRECKGKDTDECGAKYVVLNTECNGKRKVHSDKCGATTRAYKAECTVKGK